MPLSAMPASPDADRSIKMSVWMILSKILITVPLAAIGILLLMIATKMGNDGLAIGQGAAIVLFLAASAAMATNRWVLGGLFIVCVLLLGFLYIVAVLFAAIAASK